MAISTAAVSDQALQPPPGDTVQQVLFVKEERNRLLATAGWDGCVQIWECPSPSNSVLRMEMRQPFPVFAIAWNMDHSHLFLGDAEGQVKAWDPVLNSGYVVGGRSAPIRSLAYCMDTRALISGSWDHSICFWDQRKIGPFLELHTKGRIFGLAMAFPILAAIQSDKNVTVWDMRVLGEQGKGEGTAVNDDMFKYQMRSVAISPDAKSLALGLIDGRIFIKKIAYRVIPLVEPDYTFKCHRDHTNSYGINTLCYNPLHGTVLHSGGSNGGVNTWDLTARQKIKGFGDLEVPVTSLDVSSDSALLAYATGSDWHNGEQALPSKLFLRDISNEWKRSLSIYAS